MKYTFLFLCMFCLSCDVSVKKKNDSQDIEKAKEFCSNFYLLIKKRQFSEAAISFGKEVGYSDGLEILNKADSLLGKLDSVAFVDGKSERATSSKKGVAASFDLNFQAFYEKGKANEEIVIELVNDSLKITGYHPRIKI